VANDAYRGTMTGGREGFCRNSRSRNTLRPLVTAAAVHCDPLGRGLCRARWARALPAAWSKLLMGAASPHLDDHGVLPLRKAALLHSRVQVVPPPAGMPGVRGGVGPDATAGPLQKLGALTAVCSSCRSGLVLSPLLQTISAGRIWPPVCAAAHPPARSTCVCEIRPMYAPCRAPGMPAAYLGGPGTLLVVVAAVGHAARCT